MGFFSGLNPFNTPKKRSPMLDDLLWENEIRTNRILAVVCLATIIALVAAIAINWVPGGIYERRRISGIKLFIDVLLLSAALAYYAATDGRSRWVKMIMLGAVLGCTLLTTEYLFLLMFAESIVMSILYFDRRFTAVVSVMTIAAMCVKQPLMVYSGIYDLNYVQMVGESTGDIVMLSTDAEIIATYFWEQGIWNILMLVIIALLALWLTAVGLRIMSDNAQAGEKQAAMGRELEIAAGIQRGMLPVDFPDEREYGISAFMSPAKDVGGDFYDFFAVDARHVAVVMADVSGKGVPASLFMASAKTLIRTNALNGMQPDAVFEAANKALCESNREKLFVTAWMGVLNLEDGRLSYVNAGHNPPMVLRRDGGIERIDDKPNFVLGRKKNMVYREHRMDLGPGDRLFLYTDGVTEAVGRDGGMFSEGRLMESLKGCAGSGVDALVEDVRGKVSEFTDGCEQSDDMTMLALEFKAPLRQEAFAVKEFIACKEEYPSIMGFIRESLESRGCTEKLATDMEVCASEILSNIDQYAYRGRGDGVVRISVELSGRTAGISFADLGPEYNPLERGNPDIDRRLKEHKIGGFGIFIVKKMMDDVCYERADGWNILTIRKEM